jgi:hypothetical protein
MEGKHGDEDYRKKLIGVGGHVMSEAQEGVRLF